MATSRRPSVGEGTATALEDAQSAQFEATGEALRARRQLVEYDDPDQALIHLEAAVWHQRRANALVDGVLRDHEQGGCCCGR